MRVHDRLTHALTTGLVRPATQGETESIPVAEHLRALFDGRGLVRGRIVWCAGDAAMSLGLQVVARATQEGSWLAVIGLDDLGLQAAFEHGVALDRTVVVGPMRTPREWISAVGAAVEGFALVLLGVPRGVTAGDAQRLATRIQARRAVAVCVDCSRTSKVASVFSPDVVVHTATTEWHGIEHGAGHVRSRDLEVEVSGRRVARSTRHTLRHVG